MALLFRGDNASRAVADMLEVSGTLGQLTTTLSPGYGFTAIIVAFLGRLNPLGVIPAGLLLALVTFSAWRPFWMLIGAWFFGALMYLSLYVQGRGDPVGVSLGGALYRDGAGADFTGCAAHPAAPAGDAGAAVSGAGVIGILGSRRTI